VFGGRRTRNARKETAERSGVLREPRLLRTFRRIFEGGAAWQEGKMEGIQKTAQRRKSTSSAVGDGRKKDGVRADDDGLRGTEAVEGGRVAQERIVESGGMAVDFPSGFTERDRVGRGCREEERHVPIGLRGPTWGGTRTNIKVG